MPRLQKKLLAGFSAFVAASVSAFAAAFPGPAACLFVPAIELHHLPDGLLTDSASRDDHQRFMQLVQEARARIRARFGPVESAPILVFFHDPEGIGPFRLNAFGSAQFIGGRACVMVGPKGHTVDVVAHELMHAEVHHRIGYVQRFLQLPAWLDEGIAMQVDHRSRYAIAWEDMPHAHAVRVLITFSSFFSGDEATVVANYTRAKYEAAVWLEKVGADSLYERLQRMKSGASLAEVMDH